jgi:hypothetical protein
MEVDLKKLMKEDRDMEGPERKIAGGGGGQTKD